MRAATFVTNGSNLLLSLAHVRTSNIYWYLAISLAGRSSGQKKVHYELKPLWDTGECEGARVERIGHQCSSRCSTFFASLTQYEICPSARAAYTQFILDPAGFLIQRERTSLIYSIIFRQGLEVLFSIGRNVSWFKVNATIDFVFLQVLQLRKCLLKKLRFGFWHWTISRTMLSHSL